MSVPSSDRLREVLERATALSAEQLGVERVGVWVFDENRTTLSACIQYSRRSRSHKEDTYALKRSACPRYFESALSNRVVAVDDARTNPVTSELASYLDQVKATALLDAPIYRQGRVFGIVCHEHEGGVRPWTQHEKEFAASVADMIALFFEEAATADALDRLAAQQREVLERDRLAALGILSRFVAHDINNAVAPVLLWSQKIVSSPTNQPSQREWAQSIMRAGEHIADLARRLLEMSIGRTPVTLRFGVTDLVESALPLLAAIAGPEITIKCENLAASAEVLVDPIEVTRILCNLVANARDASKPGSEVTIRSVVESEEVHVTVIDHGTGMTPEQQERLFEPFSTTKGHGTGLGLLGVRSAVEQLGGRLSIRSQIGEGTSVAFNLPLA